MRKFVKTISIVLMLLTILCLTACGDPKEEESAKLSGSPFEKTDLIGQWKGTGDEISTVTFTKDGNYLDDAGSISMEGTYTVNEQAGTITVHEKDYGMVFVYYVELSDKNLTIQTDNGRPRTFIKK